MTPLEYIQQRKIVAIVRGLKPEYIVRLGHALEEGGIGLMEVTYDQKAPETWKDTAAAIEAVEKEFGDRLLVGRRREEIDADLRRQRVERRRRPAARQRQRSPAGVQAGRVAEPAGRARTGLWNIPGTRAIMTATGKSPAHTAQTPPRCTLHRESFLRLPVLPDRDCATHTCR